MNGTGAPRLMLVTDRLRTRGSLLDLIAAAVDGGVDAVQIREKDLSFDELFALAGAIRQVCAGRALVLVNGAPLIAARLGLGLHLPERGLDPASARRLLGTEAIIGRSVHSPEAAAERSGADFLVAGHVFETTSKPGRRPLGLDGLRTIVGASPLPVLAIGGIDPTRISDVVSAGAHGVAMIGAFSQSPDPRATAHEARAILDGVLSTAGLRVK